MNQEIDLLTELVQALGQDVASLKKSLANPPKVEPPVDYRPALEALGQQLGQVKSQLGQLSQRAAVPTTPVAPPTPPIDLSGLERRLQGQLDRIEARQQASPAYVMSQAVRYGVFGFWLLVLALVASTWYCFAWKDKAERYLSGWTEDNWRVRYTEQANPAYYASMEGLFAKEAAKVQQWTVNQEQADEKRLLAQKAARQAQALGEQARQLEKGKGSKPPRR